MKSMVVGNGNINSVVPLKEVIRIERLRGGGPLRCHCVAHIILKSLTSGMTKLTTNKMITNCVSEKHSSNWLGEQSLRTN